MGSSVRKFSRQFALEREELPIEEIDLTPEAITGEVQEIDVELIATSPYQPRTKFSEAGIRTLADSVNSVGLINPVAVRVKNAAYELITGERRLRAVKLLGRGTIKATVHDVDDLTAAIMAFDENFRRKNLSEYENYRWITLMIEAFNFKQVDLAEKLSLTAGRLSQIMAVGKLPADVVDRITVLRFVTEHHIRALRRLQRMDSALMYDLLADMETARLDGVAVTRRYNQLVAQSAIVLTPLDGVLEELAKKTGYIRGNPGRFSPAELKQIRRQLRRMQELASQFLQTDSEADDD